MNNKLSTSKVDERGRITIPKEIRKSTGIDSGDLLCMIEETEDRIILRKLTLDDLIEEAEQEYKEGKTIPLDEVKEELL